MSATCIKSPSTIIIVVPGYGMIVAIFSTFIAVFIKLCNYIQIGVDIFIIIPFINAFPFCGYAFHCFIGCVCNQHCCFPYIWITRVTFKISTHQFIVPCPIIFCICCRVDTHKATTSFYIPLKCYLFICVQNIAGGT